MITSIRFRAMGCQVEIKLDVQDNGETILSQMPARFEILENTLSRFRPQSELMQMNARAGEWVSVSDVLFENIHLAKHMARLTEGLFNPLVLSALIASGYDRSFELMDSTPTVEASPVADWRSINLNMQSHLVRLPYGSGLDLGGIAKGWTAQHIARALSVHGPCLVNIGGDIATVGAPEGLPGWQIDIADPDSSGDLVALWLRDTAIVTSGIDYRHWSTTEGHVRHHIINPSTGEPTQTDIRTVTVVHRHAPTAEAYAKAVFLKGSEAGLDWINTRWDAAGLVVRQDGAVLATNTFISYFQERVDS